MKYDFLKPFFFLSRKKSDQEKKGSLDFKDFTFQDTS